MEQVRGFELRTVLTSAGGEIATDPARCRDALSRSGMFPPHQVDGLVAATTVGVAYSVWVAQGQGPPPRLADLAAQVQRAGIDPARAEWAVRTWADAVGTTLEGSPQYADPTGAYPPTGPVGAAYPPTQVVDQYPPTAMQPAAGAGPGGYGGPGGGPPPWVGAPPPSVPQPAAQKRSPLPIVLAAVAAFVVIAVIVAVLALGGNDDGEVIANGDEETTTTDEGDETTTTEEDEETTTTEENGGEDDDDQLAADTELIADLWDGLNDAFTQGFIDGGRYQDEHTFPGMNTTPDACEQGVQQLMADNGWTDYTEVYEFDESSVEPTPDFIVPEDVFGPAAGQAPEGRIYEFDIAVDASATPDPPSPDDFTGPVHATIIDDEAFFFFTCG